MKRLNIIQFALVLIALTGGIGCFAYGFLDRSSQSEGVALETGYNGGALGLGIICAAAIIGFVQLEIAKMKLEK